MRAWYLPTRPAHMTTLAPYQYGLPWWPGEGGEEFNQITGGQQAYWWDDHAGAWKVYIPGTATTRSQYTDQIANIPVYAPGGIGHPDLGVGAYPDGQRGVPLPVFGGSTVIPSSMAISAPRWVKVCAYVDEFADPLEIPLVDDDGVPLLGPETTPDMIARQSGRSSILADAVTNPKGVAWSDALIGWRQNADYVNAGAYAARVTLRLKREPYDHWVLVIALGWGQPTASIYRNVMVDLFGTGYGARAGMPLTVGSSGVGGHYQITLGYPTTDFTQAAGAHRSNFNAPQAVRGAIDVAAGGTGTYYLATPNALVGDANPFATGATQVPAVRVLGSLTTGSYITHAPESNWDPTTLGLGGVIAGGTALQNPAYLYATSVFWSGARWGVTIFNNITGSAANRTFFVFAKGRRS